MITDDPSCIQNHILDFYQNLFKADSSVVSNFDVISLIIPHMVTDEKNLTLFQCPTPDEIQHTFFHLDAHSAPGPNGFTGIFFKLFWDVIKFDVCSAVCSFFYSGIITLEMNSSIMILLPKVYDAISIEQFRPIVLSNFCPKIVTKILANHLVIIATRIISCH